MMIFVQYLSFSLFSCFDFLEGKANYFFFSIGPANDFGNLVIMMIFIQYLFFSCFDFIEDKASYFFLFYFEQADDFLEILGLSTRKLMRDE